MRYVFRTMANGDVIEIRKRQLNAAKDADLVKGICARLRRRGVEAIGRRVLADNEIQLCWPAILQKPVSRPVGLVFAWSSGVRPGEAAGTSRAELERLSEKGRDRWTIPAVRSKNGRANLVPLSEMVRQTVLSALELAEDDLTVPDHGSRARRGDGAICREP
jgi:integrase